MSSQLSSRDWELLSAYLDRRLKPRELASLEARLSADPDLSAALGEIQRTRDALRSLPRLRAPRNFTLTPQMVGQRSPVRTRPASRLAPVFGFASALATFILVLVIVGDLLGILAPARKQVALAPQPTPPVAAASPLSTVAPGVGALKSAAPLTPESQPPTSAPEVNAQALQAQPAPTSRQGLTETMTMTLSVQAALPVTETTETPGLATSEAETETITTAITETMVAKEASGMGGTFVSGPNESLPFSNAIITARGPQWNTTVAVTVSPTETLTFPVTVTMEGPGLTVTYDLGVGKGGGPEEGEPTITPPPDALPMLPEPTSTPESSGMAELSVPTETPPQAIPSSSNETAQPAPTESPEALAQNVAPLTAPETPARAAVPAESISSDGAASQTTRPGQAALRIAELVLAALAFISGFVAFLIWLSKKI